MANFKTPIFFLLGTLVFGNQQPTLAVDTIAFGSCARERREQPVWTDILAQDPDLFLMIGDNHYADFWSKGGGPVQMQPVTEIQRFVEAYEQLAQKPGFVKLKQTCPIMATWDDHDYGANDQGNDFALREESQREFVKFWGFKKDHPIHEQSGVYHSETFESEKGRVQVIVLDTRYHRDALEIDRAQRPGPGPYTASTDTSKTILGAAQWEWLEQQLLQPADIRIVASSIQVVAHEHGYESWGNFPHERTRLFNLIKKTEANGVIFISGDRHLIEFSCNRDDGPYPMWDFTSSGLTQAAQSIQEVNSYRIGPVKREQNYGLITIDWADDNKQQTKILLQGFGKGNVLLVEQTITLSTLRPLERSY